jgi:predicted nucleic acid-binding protein
VSFVLDASVVLAWLLPDERSDDATRLIERAVAERPRAPSLLMLEVANALLQAERRGRIRRAMRLDLLDAFTTLPIALEPLGAETMLRAGELAGKHRLTLYDASYLELALSRDCALASFVEALVKAARIERVPVLPTD